MVKAPWRERKLENYEFSGNSPERVKALLYMRQVGGGLDSWLSFDCERCIFTMKTKCQHFCMFCMCRDILFAV